MKRNFQRLIKDLEAAELREELQMLFDRFEPVRAYYKMELGSGGSDATVTKYKKKIYQSFFRGRGKRARSQSRNIIKEFKQISIFPADIVELELYRCQMMVEWISYWHNENYAYFDSLINAYRSSIAQIKDQQLEEKLAPQAKAIADAFQQYPHRVSYTLIDDYERAFN